MSQEGNQAELLLLIVKYLQSSPLQSTFRTICRELETCQLLPSTIDYQGTIQHQTYQQLVRYH